MKYDSGISSTSSPFSIQFEVGLIANNCSIPEIESLLKNIRLKLKKLTLLIVY